VRRSSTACRGAHIDIAGVADVEKPGGWRTRGCSGFGARLLADFAVGFGS
jgi:leucyl aminopeptidase